MPKRKSRSSLPVLPRTPPPSEIVFDEDGTQQVLFLGGNHGYKNVRRHKQGYWGAIDKEDLYTKEFETPKEAAIELAKKKRARELGKCCISAAAPGVCMPNGNARHAASAHANICHGSCRSCTDGTQDRRARQQCLRARRPARRHHPDLAEAPVPARHPV